jgi:hypothetical protein
MTGRARRRRGSSRRGSSRRGSSRPATPANVNGGWVGREIPPLRGSLDDFTAPCAVNSSRRAPRARRGVCIVAAREPFRSMPQLTFAGGGRP